MDDYRLHHLAHSQKGDILAPFADEDREDLDDLRAFVRAVRGVEEEER